MASKEELHHLIDRLPDGEMQAAHRFLEFLCAFASDPFLQALRDAPEDDEPTTSEEDSAADKAWQEYQEGKGRPWDDVSKELAGD